MKKMLDGLYVVLGTLFMFGLPSAALALSAWFGDGVIAMLHTSSSAMHSITFQLEAMAIVFGTSAGGLAAALALFTALWLGARTVKRMAERMAEAPAPRVSAATRTPEAATVGRIDHSGTHQRRRQRAA